MELGAQPDLCSKKEHSGEQSLPMGRMICDGCEQHIYGVSDSG